jgi:hypothetical protein
MDSVVAALNFLFGCHHHNLSRVFTIPGRTYRVCCDCGTEFKYSLTNMSIERRLPRDSMLTCLRIA